MVAPALLIAIPLVAGVAAGVLVAPAAVAPAVLAAVALSCAIAALLRGRGAMVACAVAAGSACVGISVGARAQHDANMPSLLAWMAPQRGSRAAVPIHVTGTLREDATAGAQVVSATVDVSRVSARGESADVTGGVRLTVAGALAGGRAPQWRAGRTLEFDAILRQPLDYRDPGVPGDRLRLARQGVVLLGTVKSAALVTLVARGGPLDESASALRAFVRRAVVDAVGSWSARSAGVVTAILIGDRSGLDPSDERRLQDAGTYHVIAISGGNIALLTMLLIVAGRFSGIPPRVVAAGAIVLLAFYGYAAGLAPSVLRATSAGALYLAGRAIDRQGPALNALAMAAAWAAAMAPLTVVDPGFILSFGATLGIVVAASRMMPSRHRLHAASPLRRGLSRVARGALELGAATLCAEIALAPVGARLFGRISVAGLALNFIAIPLMSIIQVAGMVAVAVRPLALPLARTAGGVAHVATTGLIWSAGLVDAAPWLVVDVPPPASWLIAAWYLACGAFLIVRRRLRIAAAVAAVTCGVLVFVGAPITRATIVAAPRPGWSRIAFLDVGQGDAALLWPAAGEPFMIDAGGVPGGAFDVGRRVTVPAAWALRVRRLSSVVLSHGDPDHIGGVPALLRAFAPREIIDGIPVPTHVPLEQLREEARARNITWRSLHTGDRFDVGVAHVRVLNPPSPDWERLKVRNDDSVVLEVRIGEVRVVLPGDISAAVEPGLLPLLAPAPLTIVKAPHHGSGGSSSPAFIAALQPAAVIFSAGGRNPFGHPAPAVLDRYRASGAEIFRTDQDGAVFVETDGHDLEIWTWGSSRTWATSSLPPLRPGYEPPETTKRTKGNY